MSSINFSHFKKIAQDKKSATLLHPDGHHLKIAIVALKPELKKKLEEMPLHQADPTGPVEVPDAQESAAPAAQEPAPTEQAAIQGAPIEVTAEAPKAALEPAETAPVPAAAPEQVASNGALPAPDMVPSKGPEEATAPAAPTVVAPPTPEQEALAKTKEDMAFGQDLSNGHIQPKTYADLFHEKSTLGKVGTIFGLLVGGMGSGLTHQPNALMAMMDKQIQNDLEAQKQDQSNKQNWFKLSLEHTKNQTENAVRSSDAYLKATEADKHRMLNEAYGISQSEATVRALNSGRLAALQDQQNAVNKMPPGADRERAQTALNGMTAANQQQMYKDNLGVANQKQQLLGSNSNQEGFNPPPADQSADPNKKYSAVDTQKLEKAVNMGKFAPDMPGAIPPGDRQVVLGEQKDLENHRDTWSNAEKAFRILDQIKNSGQIPAAGTMATLGGLLGSAAGSMAGPLGIGVGGTAGANVGSAATHSAKDFYERLRSTVMDSLVGQLDKNKSYEERQRIADSMMPSWTDDSQSRTQAHKELQQQFSADPREKATNLRLYGLKAPEPKYNYMPGKINSTREDVGNAATAISQGFKPAGDAIVDALSGFGNKDAPAYAGKNAPDNDKQALVDALKGTKKSTDKSMAGEKK